MTALALNALLSLKRDLDQSSDHNIAINTQQNTYPVLSTEVQLETGLGDPKEKHWKYNNWKYSEKTAVTISLHHALKYYSDLPGNPCVVKLHF